MAHFYMDTDGGSNANAGTSWAAAKLTMEGLLAVMSAGDRGWIQGAAEDTAAAARTFTSPGTIGNPCIILGVKDGTTNEPPVLSDLAVRGTDTLPILKTTGAGGHTTLAGIALLGSVRVDCIDRTLQGTQWTVEGCEVIVRGSLRGGAAYINCLINMIGTGIFFSTSRRFVNCEWQGSASLVSNSSGGDMDFIANDLSVVVSGNSLVSSAALNLKRFINCKMPATFSLFGAVPTGHTTACEVVSSSNAAGLAAGESVQDYQYEDAFGVVELETVKVRTGGADDGADGPFSYVMSPHTDTTLESSDSVLKGPWIAVWVEGDGTTAKTFTVHIANDGAGDLLENEVWLQILTPSEAGNTRHDHSFHPGNARLFNSATAITDDTGSTWGGSVGNHQKLSVTKTPDFSGWAYARVCYAKRNGADLYIDPKIVIT